MDNAERIRNHRLAHGIPGGRGVRLEPPSLGVKNKDAAALTGFSPSALSNAAKRGQLLRLDDGSYDTLAFERWVRAKGVPDFSVPPGQRGALYENDDLDEIPEHQRGTTNALELLQLKVQAMRLRVAHQARQLESARAEFVRRDVVERTVRDATDMVEAVVAAFGSKVAPSLTGVDNEYEIKRRLDGQVRAVLREIQDRVGAMVADGPQ